jgi:beta-glucanase (GH16 family)
MKSIYLLFLLLICSLPACGDKDSVKPNPPEEKPESFVPADYSLVWSDEFNDAPNGLPGNEWWFETGNSGWGNNEPQNYVDRVLGTDTVAKIQNGQLTITAYKLTTPYQGSDIISARMNTVQSWKYGYFEMSAKLPGGKGTWAAFWMLPKNFQSWPRDGEIDIMEYVGYRPDVTQASVHTEAYNHVAGTEKTATHSAPGAERKFYTYGLLWTADEIAGYIDGVPYFSFRNDKAGNKSTWPFDEPFYLKLNLAIGGNWGGQQGIDPAIFPSRYEIDYVRVYQPQ